MEDTWFTVGISIAGSLLAGAIVAAYFHLVNVSVVMV